MTHALPREFDRIDRLFRPLAAGFPGALGLGDDAALIDPPPGTQLVVTSDAMVEGVHFLADWRPQDIAAKLLRTNLSDLAAMGAAPLAYTLTVALPRAVEDEWLAGFCEGLAGDQAAFGIHLAGGDSVSTAGPPSFTITAFGTVPTGTAIRRNGAKPGDVLFVTGTLGDAALALAHMLDGQEIADPTDREALLQRLLRPTPRLAFGPALRAHATAALDISDGLVQDVGHIARASGVAINIAAANLPRSAAAQRLLDAAPQLLETALIGGDDYEIAFTVPPQSRASLLGAAARAGVPVTAIGRVVAGAGAGLVDAAGNAIALSRSGWSHF